ncbi:calcified cuticle protein CP19.0 isoform B [Penaeus vannamei]|uniref:Calcified cuticle protein CP19.0 isoform B n=1 Tax=Penaeus vannamei TaxID=6689 RepID=A0A3R7SY71_PENVA|nr:calcified cuticle protein CP19.0 isoform B [Penaeus vannamei]
MKDRKNEILLAVLGVCSAVPFIQDTPEVQAEKARFFQSFRAAQWYGPVAATVPRRRRHHHPRGRHHEVAAARTAFLNAYNAQVRATAGAAPAVPSFARPTALLQRFLPPQSSQSGPAPWQPPSRRTPRLRPQVADTPEVAAAKQEFFNTFQRQAAAAAPPSRNYF